MRELILVEYNWQCDEGNDKKQGTSNRQDCFPSFMMQVWKEDKSREETTYKASHM